MVSPTSLAGLLRVSLSDVPSWIQAFAAAAAVVFTVAVWVTARAANREVRIERQLAVLPWLETSISATPNEQGGLGTDIQVHNQSGQPAINVYALFGSQTGDHRQFPDPASGLLGKPPKMPTLAAGLKGNFGHILAADGARAGLLLRIAHSGPLGGTRWAAYVLSERGAADAQGRRDLGWDYLGRCVKPSVEGAETICD